MVPEVGVNRTIAVVPHGEDLAAELDRRLEDVGIRTVETANDALVSRADVRCLVVTAGTGERSLPELAAEIRDRDADLPVVAFPRDGSESLAGRLSAVGGVRYLPRAAGHDALADRVRDSIEEHERRRERARDQAVLDAVLSEFPYHLFVKDERARHLAMTDVPDVPDPQEAVGETDRELYPNLAESEAMYEEDLALIESGDSVHQREERHHGQRASYWAEVTKVPWRQDDDVRGLVGMQLNVTDRKELERKLERRGTLHRRIARYLAHDIRNPLTLAHGHLDMARESPEPERFDVIEDALDRIEAVVDNMDVVIGDASADVSELSRVSLDEAVADAWQTVDTADATLRWELPREADILADRSPLQELLENLFRNAVEHGGSGVTVTVDTLPDGFVVADDGVGLRGDAEALMDYGVTTDAGGTGLGLAIVSEIADTYGWTVTAAESVDGGARFEVRDALMVTERYDVATGTDLEIDGTLDVGDARPPGEARALGKEEWAVTGGGENVWGDTNEHHFTYAEVDGDVRITARLTDLERVEEYTKAGVSIRTGLAESDPLGFVGMTSDHGSELLWRVSPDADTTSAQFDAAADLPNWYRLERVGDALTAFVSENGHSWTAVDQRHVDASGTVYAGLGVCSHDTQCVAEARFDGVRVEALGAPRSPDE